MPLNDDNQGKIVDRIRQICTRCDWDTLMMEMPWGAFQDALWYALKSKALRGNPVPSQSWLDLPLSEQKRMVKDQFDDWKSNQS